MTRRTILAGTIGSVASGVLSAAAQTLSDTDLERIAAAPRTAEDHSRLAAHYRAHAAEHQADAKLHDSIANTLRKTRPQDDDAWDLARDAAHYAEHSREAAEALRDLAAAHTAIAERLRKK